MNWDHDALAVDLAAHLKSTPRRMVWLNMQLGPSGSPRPDIFSLAKSYVRPMPVAYEVKVSREDFRADVTAAKWSAYTAYAHAVIFAAPAGMITKGDIPEMCGLIVRGENGWRMMKKPVINPRPIDQSALLKLLIDGVHREGMAARHRHWNSNDHLRKFANKFGAEAARWVADAASVESKLKYAETCAQNIIDDAKSRAESMREAALREMPGRYRDLLEILELDAGASTWEIKAKISAIKRAGNGDSGRVAEIVNQLSQIVRDYG